MSDQSTQAAGNTQATGSAQPGAEGASASGTAAAPAAAPAAAAPAASQSQQATEGQPAGGNAAASSEGQGAQGGKPAVTAPEKYEFKAPDNIALDDAVVAEFSTVAKELNLSQDAAQKVIDKIAPKLAEGNVKAIVAAMQKRSQEWQDAVRNDTEIGGEKLGENLAVANKAVERFASPELRALLNPFDPVKNPTGTGLGNHPALVRLFWQIGKAISEDRPVTGSTDPGKGARDPATALYGGTSSKA